MGNKVILITGTNSGFGYLTAKGAAANGHTVYAAMRNTSTRNAERAKELDGIENVRVVEIDVDRVCSQDGAREEAKGEKAEGARDHGVLGETTGARQRGKAGFRSGRGEIVVGIKN